MDIRIVSQILTLGNCGCATTEGLYTTFWKLLFSILLDTCPGIGWYGHRAILGLICWENTKLFH